MLFSNDTFFEVSSTAVKLMHLVVPGTFSIPIDAHIYRDLGDPS